MESIEAIGVGDLNTIGLLRSCDELPDSLEVEILDLGRLGAQPLGGVLTLGAQLYVALAYRLVALLDVGQLLGTAFGSLLGLLCAALLGQVAAQQEFERVGLLRQLAQRVGAQVARLDEQRVEVREGRVCYPVCQRVQPRRGVE